MGKKSPRMTFQSKKSAKKISELHLDRGKGEMKSHG